MLYQGGAELAFDEPKITRDMIVVVQGLVVFFAGALEGLFRRGLARALRGPVCGPSDTGARRACRLAWPSPTGRSP